jgi:hypothetical protein
VLPQFIPVPSEQQAILAKPILAQAAGSKIKIEPEFYTCKVKAEDIESFYNNALLDWKPEIVPAVGRVTMQWTKDYQSFEIDMCRMIQRRDSFW